MVKFICLDDEKKETDACTARVNKLSEDLDFINRTRQRLNEVETRVIIGNIKGDGNKWHTTNN